MTRSKTLCAYAKIGVRTHFDFSRSLFHVGGCNESVSVYASHTHRYESYTVPFMRETPFAERKREIASFGISGLHPLSAEFEVSASVLDVDERVGEYDSMRSSEMSRVRSNVRRGDVADEASMRALRRDASATSTIARDDVKLHDPRSPNNAGISWPARASETARPIESAGSPRLVDRSPGSLGSLDDEDEVATPVCAIECCPISCDGSSCDEDCPRCNDAPDHDDLDDDESEGYVDYGPRLVA